MIDQDLVHTATIELQSAQADPEMWTKVLAALRQIEGVTEAHIIETF